MSPGDYKTTLDFSQPGVPTATDNSLDFILPVLAAPIVQKIVGGASLGLDTVLILNPEQNAFRAFSSQSSIQNRNMRLIYIFIFQRLN